MNLLRSQLAGILGLSMIAAALPGLIANKTSAQALAPTRLHEPSQHYFHLAVLQEAPVTAEHGEELYKRRCALCHNADRSGKPPLGTSLIDTDKKHTDEELTKLIKSGKGRMPAFASLPDMDVQAIILFLKTAPVDPPAEPAS